MEQKNTGQLSLACTGNLRNNWQPRRLGSVLPSSNAIILNFVRETFVCIRVTHRKSEELSHDIRYNRGNTHGFHEFYALFFARKQISILTLQ